MRATIPLAIVVGLLAFGWTEVSLNFTFHWFTDGDLGNGLALPENFHLILPAAFVSWAFFFAAGADNSAFVKVAIASIVGSLGALGTMALSSATADLPDFWAIALWVGVFATVLVLLSAVGDMWYTPASFGGFAAVFFWWIATGLDNWAANGGGQGNSVEALGDPSTAGLGAFSGVISTPFGWVWFNIMVTLLCGCVLGWLSVRITALITPYISPPERAPAPEEKRTTTA